MTNTIHSTKIIRLTGGEYVVRAYGKRDDGTAFKIPSADYFTSDRQDAQQTAQAMVQAPLPPKAKPILTFLIKGKPVKKGARILDFRGDPWTFVQITREPEPGKEGKIVAKSGGTWTQELYPSVFGGVIADPIGAK